MDHGCQIRDSQPGEERMRSTAASIACLLGLLGCSTVGLGGDHLPGRSIRATLENAIRTLEAGDCRGFAVHFLSPIKLEQIQDRERYEQRMACSPENQRNIDDVVFALRMARLAEPETNGVIATIDMTGAGTRPERFFLVRYTDKRWYFNRL
jgi:hypothetical protein